MKKKETLLTKINHLLFFFLGCCLLIKAYSFLDPKTQGKLLAAYIIGIAVGQCIIFLVVIGVIHFREWIVQRKKRTESPYY